MKFTKMHGAGNDYIYVDCFNQPAPTNIPQLAPAMCHRHFGIGADGVILIRPSTVADARMQMFNVDGSEAEMCGNGLRCVAKYVYDYGICHQEKMALETGNGVLRVTVEARNDRAERVCVNMGKPILEPAAIPTTLTGTPVVDQELLIDNHRFRVTSLSMGNPHCVIFVPEASDELVLKIGPKIENCPEFPERVNVEFVEVISPSEVRQRTWERGSGETWACGTGASAVCVAGVLAGKTEDKILNHLLGGDLELFWNRDSDHVFMTGPASEVYRGEWPEAD